MIVRQQTGKMKKIRIVLEDKIEANALRDMANFITKDMYENGEVSREVYELSIIISEMYTDGVIEVPLTEEEKENV
jgi:hypothetical protein